MRYLLLLVFLAVSAFSKGGGSCPSETWICSSGGDLFKMRISYQKSYTYRDSIQPCSNFKYTCAYSGEATFADSNHHVYQAKIVKVNYKCPSGTKFNAEKRACLSDPCENINPPSTITIDGASVPLLTEFYETNDCILYAVNNYISPFHCLLATDIDSSTKCPKSYLYGNKKTCQDYTPPPVYQGFPLAGRYPSENICNEAIIQFGQGQGGICVGPLPGCPYVFGYFHRQDHKMPNSDANNTNIPEAGPMPTNSDKTPAVTDDVNDSVDLNPLLTQNAEISDRLHNDSQKLSLTMSNGFESMHRDLSSLQNMVATTGQTIANAASTGNSPVDLSGVEDRLDTANDHLSNIETNISGISSFFSALGDLINDPQSISDVMQGSIDEIVGKYIGKQVIDMPDCGTVPTIGAHIMGRDIVLISDDIVNRWPLEIFRLMIVFFFALSGVIITFRGN